MCCDASSLITDMLGQGFSTGTIGPSRRPQDINQRTVVATVNQTAEQGATDVESF